MEKVTENGSIEYTRQLYKSKELVEEVNRLNIDIIGLIETKNSQVEKLIGFWHLYNRVPKQEWTRIWISLLIREKHMSQCLKLLTLYHKGTRECTWKKISSVHYLCNVWWYKSVIKDEYYDELQEQRNNDHGSFNSPASSQKSNAIQEILDQVDLVT